MTNMSLGPNESITFREEVFVLRNPRPSTNRVHASMNPPACLIVKKIHSVAVEQKFSSGTIMCRVSKASVCVAGLLFLPVSELANVVTAAVKVAP